MLKGVGPASRRRDSKCKTCKRCNEAGEAHVGRRVLVFWWWRPALAYPWQACDPSRAGRARLGSRTASWPLT